MTEDKDLRRKKFLNKTLKKQKTSEEERFLSREKHQKKKNLEYIREEEIWDEWEQEYNSQ